MLYEAIFAGEEVHICGRKDNLQNVVRPLLEEYFAWMKTLHPESGRRLADALRYSLNQKQQLMAFLEYGDVPISNNLAVNVNEKLSHATMNF